MVLPVCDRLTPTFECSADYLTRRYFLFHAALIPCVCIRADPHSAEAARLRGDIETTRMLLRTTFIDNPLAVRALEVMGQIFPEPPSVFELPTSQQFDEAAADFSMWEFDSSDPLSSFGWPDFGFVS